MNYLKQRIKSFSYAFNGLSILLKEEPNARIHLAAAILVVLAGYLLNISVLEWMIIIICIGVVIAMELMNSALENLADYVSPEKHELIKKTKDLAAAGVLITAIVAVIVGLLIFIPKLKEVLGA